MTPKTSNIYWEKKGEKKLLTGDWTHDLCFARPEPYHIAMNEIYWKNCLDLEFNYVTK